MTTDEKLDLILSRIDKIQEIAEENNYLLEILAVKTSLAWPEEGDEVSDEIKEMLFSNLELYGKHKYEKSIGLNMLSEEEINRALESYNEWQKEKSEQ